ncbi:type I-U CRISPR-associated RAMP protein Csb1/Cas7u [Pseudofrankia sp. BMG5.36]|uniref:type I-G CRISPR-associated RAMP protein Csb1/Cas7g n=1 Tax=Pseudofrankia sp. BMG5.36 TaxID=1834512 RepID=UPI0008D9D563|nr:type I-U CRISPR-associated RAMP protein Csb1/Cas7u [Pseudofrankia sp. BMG5.36]OHV43947.1 type I-U CRISPR-associated protein Cas7 [Pseudofrankia sp. BMG5.36]
MSGGLVERLVAAVGDERDVAGIAITGTYRAAGDGKVSPPTFPGGPYIFEPRHVDGAVSEVVVLDQVPSEANRIEEALLAARDGGRIELPLFELTAKTSRGEIRLTSLEFPHRYADAYLRDSLVNGVRFDKSPVGQRLRGVSAIDVRPLYQLDPGSLIFGAWDSHRTGRWPKFARLYSSSIVGLDPKEGIRRATRSDPLNLVGAIDDTAKAEGDWAFVVPGGDGKKKSGQKPSEIGHGNIVDKVDKLPPGGVTISEARRSAWISFAGLERLRFGDASREATQLARAALAALALAGDRLAFGRPSIWLRSGCDLVRTDESIGFDRGGELEPVAVTAAEAIAAFRELRDRAASAGIVMEKDAVSITPIPGLANAIEYAVAKGAGSDGDAS